MRAPDVVLRLRRILGFACTLYSSSGMSVGLRLRRILGFACTLYSSSGMAVGLCLRRILGFVCTLYSSSGMSVGYAVCKRNILGNILGSAGCVLPGGVPSLAFAIHIPPWRGRWSCPWRQPYCILLLQIRRSGLGFRFLLLFWGCRCCCFCCYCRNY